MKDYNIVTTINTDNYGANLQAYALKKYIELLGYKVGVFDNVYVEKPKLKGIKHTLKRAIDKFNIKNEKIIKEKSSDFKRNYFELNRELDSKVYLSGSDQVWRTTNKPNPDYFLQFVGDSSIKASYAASMGENCVNIDYENRFKSFLNNFDFISVREKSTATYIKKYTEKKINCNIDPIFLLKKEEWEKIMLPVKNIPQNFTLVYLIHRPKNINKLLKWIKKIYSERIVLIDVNGVLSCTIKHDIILKTIGPQEFLWLFNNANRVVTSSFHGTAFSILFNKEVYALPNSRMPIRIVDLLSKFGISGFNEKETIFKKELTDWTSVNYTIDTEREKSKKYIIDILNYKKNINIDKTLCTGCGACYQKCPTNAIEMKLDEEGFYRPYISLEKCIKCGLCDKVCIIEKKQANIKKQAWYGWNKDSSILYNSSSGGFFRAISEEVIKNNGVVYGAVFSNDKKRVFISNSDLYSLNLFQKSKYIVSNTEESFKSVKENLINNRLVLFSGTPCQCAGLISYLGRLYENLITIDFVCGGFPSERFYRDHLAMIESKMDSKVIDIDFRPKNKGWGRYYLNIKFENGKKLFVRDYMDSYFTGFIKGVSKQKACLKCFYHEYHISDITIADFWGFKDAGIKKNKKGMSMIVANTKYGIDYIKKLDNMNLCDLNLENTKYAFKPLNPKDIEIDIRDAFFDNAKEVGFEEAAKRYYKYGILNQVKKHLIK